MSAEQIHMTGAELKRVKEKAGIEESDIEKRLGIKPPTYYNYTNKKNREKPIPLDVEERVQKDPEMAEIMNRELTPKTNQMELVVTAMQRYGDLTDSLKKMVDVVTILLTKQDSKYDDLKRNNDAIIRTNETLAEFLSLAKKEGEFVYHKKTA